MRYKMNGLKNNKGLTLIEVLASIVILSIVIISFVALFPQMSLFNEKTEENLDAISIAKEVLVEMKSTKYTTIGRDIRIDSSVLAVNPGLSSDDTLVLSGEHREKYIEISIDKGETKYKGSGLNRHKMQINVYEKNRKQSPLSTVYGFTLH